MERRNGGYAYRERLDVQADAVPVVAYLARQYRHSSPAEWSARVVAGLVLVDGSPAGPDTVLRRGQTLVWRRPPWEEPDAPVSVAILFEDDDLLGVAKPAGLPTLPGAGFLRSTLLHRVRRHAPDASPLHRLGRWTSGVVLFARTRRARAELTAQWSAREVAKRYRALVQGHPERDVFDVAVPIGPVPHPLLGTVHAASTAGKKATSRVTVLDRRADSSLCDVRITTGRPHQIRIHLAATGHPLSGDPLYVLGGVVEEDSRALPGDPGYHLHAAEIGFRHPRTNRDVTIECSPPPVLR